MDTTQLSQQVAGEVRAHMARQRKTGVELASLLQISQQSASRRMTGERVFDLDEIAEVAQWLGLSPIDLLPKTQAVAS